MKNTKKSDFLKQPLFWSTVALVGILFFLVLNIAYISNAPRTLAQAVPVTGEGTAKFLAKWVESVLPPPPPLPTVTLSASPNPINYNTASTLTWSSTNATSCTASGAWTGSKATIPDSQSTGNLTTNQTYTLTCTNATGSANRSVTVTVNAPTPDFSLSKSNDIEVTIIGGVPTVSSKSTITVDAVGSFASAVNLSVDSIAPAVPGIQYSFNDSSLTTGEYAAGSLFSVTVPGTAISGISVITIKGTSGGMTRTMSVILTIFGKDPKFENF